MRCYFRSNRFKHISLHTPISIVPLRFIFAIETPLQSYTVTPPIKPWPQRLFPKRLVAMIRRQQNLDLALQIFHYAGKFHPAFSHNYDTYHAIIHRLSRARAFEPVESLLLELQDAGINCSEDLFITVIRSYGLAGRPKMALKTFLRIQTFGVRRSVRSLNTLLNALVQNNRFSLVHLLFKYSKSKFGVVPNVFTCNILIKALCKKNDVEGARKVFDEMPAMGMVPNVVTYTTILGGYVSRGDMVGAKRVFGELFDHGWLPDATTYTILMDGYIKKGRFTDAVKVMDEMEENGVEPNDVTYGVIILAYCKEEKSGEALNLLNDMLEKKYIPNSALCCKVIDVLCSEGRVKEACKLWEKLLKKNCTPDNAITSTLIHWLCKEGNIWEARKLFNEFESGTISSLLTYNTLIGGMCEIGELCEAARLWDDMLEKGCVPNEFTYNMLIKGFLKIGKAEEVIKVVEEMLDKGCLLNESTYSLLVEGLLKLGKGEELFNILSMIISNGAVDFKAWHFCIPHFVSNVNEQGNMLEKILIETFR
ncbi:hypothetical protein IC582_014036 [Cucumis melo]|uniref:Pentatricopeptide repeat-containing protein At5g16420, mitochondrial n=1 Tax=Cucumis melo TaxID=3656 RepID=A0A1S3BPE8_CUCME|nr:pentatricopeptide repeat-containing protein At5g16420, mitochondrial [Cucumis melo]XP_008450077.1 pentatricopeptide repeat-containing protein At5g16420, mitochondrial [Cucumis melo]